MGVLRALYEKFNPPPPTPVVGVDTSELAIQAIAAAEKDLRDAVARRPIVEAVVRHSELHTARNGFGAMIDLSMRSKY